MNFTSMNQGKGKKKEIRYLKRNEFEQGNILGVTTLRSKRKNEDTDTLNEKYAVKDHLFGYTLGYIQVDEESYIRYKTRLPFILLFFIGMLLFYLLSPSSTPSKLQHIISGEPIDTTRNPEPQQSMDMTVVFGHPTQVITEANPYILFINDKDNTVYFQYDLIDEATQKVVTSTDMFPPNSMVKVNLKEVLSVGEYSFTLHFNTFDLHTMEACSSGIEERVKVIVQ